MAENDGEQGRQGEDAYPSPQEVRGTVAPGAPHRTPHPAPVQQHQPPAPQAPQPPQQHAPQHPPQQPGHHAAQRRDRQRPDRPQQRPDRPTGNRTRPRDGDAPSPADPASRAGLGRYLLLVLAAVLATMLRLPWTVLALVLAIAAVVVGIRLLISSRGTARAVWNPLVIASLAMSAFVVMTSGATIVSWPAQMELQECQDRALTITAQAECEAEFSDRLVGFFTPGG